MTTTDKKAQTIKTIIKSLTLQKNQLEGELYRLKDLIHKKQQSINTVETYSSEYKSRFYNTPIHQVFSYQNNQHFLDKLSSVLYSEKQELSQLEIKKMELLKRYHTLNQKIEGLTDILTLHQNKQQIFYDKIEDTNRTELATQRVSQRRMKDNE